MYGEQSISNFSFALGIVVSDILFVTEMRQVRASSIAAIGEHELEVKRPEKYVVIASRISGSS